LGIEMLATKPDEVLARVPMRPELLAPHGYVHGGALTAIADTLCGYGCIVNLPAGASGFVTVELKTNFLGTATDGALVCWARPLHRGRTTQVWDSEVHDEATRKVLVTFRCTQMVLWPK
jgi:uncharacterized protein (TIGR00369 family)